MGGSERSTGHYIEGVEPQDTPLIQDERAFVKDAKRVIGRHLARTVLIVGAVLAGAGVVVEKTGSFDPLSNPVDSANHPVLNDLHNSYEHLVDKLPEVDKAEADAALVTFIIENRTGATHNALQITFDPATDSGVTFVSGTFTCSPAGPDKFNCSGGSIAPETLDNFGRYECVTAPFVCFVGETFTGDSWSLRISSTVWSTSSVSSVGGIAELPNVETSPQNITSEKSTDYATPIAEGIAGAVAAAGAVGAGLYIRRKGFA